MRPAVTEAPRCSQHLGGGSEELTWLRLSSVAIIAALSSPVNPQFSLLQLGTEAAARAPISADYILETDGTVVGRGALWAWRERCAPVDDLGKLQRILRAALQDPACSVVDLLEYSCLFEDPCGLDLLADDIRDDLVEAEVTDVNAFYHGWLEGMMAVWQASADSVAKGQPQPRSGS